MERGYRPNPVWSLGAMWNWGALKMQYQKMQDLKMTDQISILVDLSISDNSPCESEVGHQI
jgi:hypothetical protein